MYVCVYNRELKNTRKPDDSIRRSYSKEIRNLLPAMEDENTGPFRRTSSRTRKVASKMVAALTSADNRTQVIDPYLHSSSESRVSLIFLWVTEISCLVFIVKAVLARLEALESDNAGAEVVEANDDDDASLDEDDQGMPFFFVFCFPLFLIL